MLPDTLIGAAVPGVQSVANGMSEQTPMFLGWGLWAVEENAHTVLEKLLVLVGVMETARQG